MLCYLLVEWVYNQHLLELVTYPVITTEQFQWTETAGKTIASVGINLVLVRCWRKPNLVKFAMGLCAVYFALSWCVERAVDAVPNEFRHASYYAAMDRTRVVENMDPQQLLAIPDNKPWYVRSLLLSQFYLTLQGNQWKQIEQEIREPLHEKAAVLDTERQALWRKYEQAEDVRQYIDVGWTTYEAAVAKYAPYRNHPDYGQRARNTFVLRAGLPPDLSREQFIAAKAPAYATYLETVIFEGNSTLGVPTLHGRDVPLRMDETTFYRYLQDTVENTLVRVAPTSSEMHSHAASRDAVALLVIPPLSIGLSLLSIVANLVALTSAWLVVYLPPKWKTRRGRAMVFSLVITAVALACASAPHAVRESNDYWLGLDQDFQTHHPVAWAAMSVPMRMEGFVCITSEPVEWIAQGMRWLYGTNSGSTTKKLASS